MRKKMSKQRMMWGIFTGIMFIGFGLCAQQKNSDQDKSLCFEFNGEAGATGWSITKYISLKSCPDKLELNSSGIDGKIYRSIKLSAGDYLVTACGTGKYIQVILAQNWKSDGVLCSLNLAQTDMWRINNASLHIELDSTLLLIVAVPATTSGSAAIKYIKIERDKPSASQ
jgi:hypothetical protein